MKLTPILDLLLWLTASAVLVLGYAIARLFGNPLPTEDELD